MKTTAHKTVLLVDDDQDDRETLLEAFDRIGAEHEILVAHDGREGLDQLGKLNGSGKLPCLIVLDINMPRMNGRDMYTALRTDPTLRHIPIVVFSTSSSQLDQLFFKHHNVPYFVKPLNYRHVVEIASKIMAHCEHKQEEN